MVPTVNVPTLAARAALELRAVKRRTRSGLRFTPWRQIAEELARRGLGRYLPSDVADAVRALPVELHPEAGLPPGALTVMEEGWRRGWALEHPSEPFPGMREAQRRAREALFVRASDSLVDMLTREELGRC
jgi:hypothetical protein